MSQQYSSVPFLAPYDFFVYIDPYDSNKIKARNKRGRIEFNHASDAGNVINSCIAALPATGGFVSLDSGTFLVTTTINPKNYLALKGAGINKTILKLANSANVDVIANTNFNTLISSRPGTGYFAEAGVLHDCTFESFSIDGNKANNATGRYGLAKIAYGWELTNIMIYNCKSDGIYTEWGTVAGCPQAPDPTGRCMEDYWTNVYTHHCDGRGITMRGPHDTYMVNVMAWGHVGNAVAFEGAAGYSGGCFVTQYHCFAAINTGTTMTLISGTEVHGSNWSVEGGLGSGGYGLDITGGGRLQLSNSVFFVNDTGCRLVAGGAEYCELEGCEFRNNNVGIRIFGNQNKISGYWHDNSVSDIQIGFAGITTGYCDVRGKCTRTPTALDWANAGNIENYVDLSVITLAGHVAIAGTPSLTTNFVQIHSTGSGTNTTLYEPITTTNTLTLTNKTLNTTDNSLTATSQAIGDILSSNGTKFVRKARGTALQVLRVNSGATDIEYASLDSERVGKATGASGASVYNIAHGLGSNPTYAFVDCSSHTTARTFTTDATNIIVTFASTIPSGTVTIYWRVVA